MLISKQWIITQEKEMRKAGNVQDCQKGTQKTLKVTTGNSSVLIMEPSQHRTAPSLLLAFALQIRSPGQNTQGECAQKGINSGLSESKPTNRIKPHQFLEWQFGTAIRVHKPPHEPSNSCKAYISCINQILHQTPLEFEEHSALG